MAPDDETDAAVSRGRATSAQPAGAGDGGVRPITVGVAGAVDTSDDDRRLEHGVGHSGLQVCATQFRGTPAAHEDARTLSELLA